MFQGKGQTIVYSSQLDDGLLYHHPVAVLEGSEACHKEVVPAGTVLLLLPAAPLSGSLPWLPQRHSSLLPVAWHLNHREAQSALGGKGDKAVSPPGLIPRSNNTSFPHRVQLHPHKVPLGHKSHIQMVTKGPGDKIRLQHTWKPKRDGTFLSCCLAASRSRVPMLPLPRSSHSPARPRCPGDSHT